MHIGLEVTKSLLNRAFKCGQRVLGTGILITPVGKRQHAIIFQKCMLGHQRLSSVTTSNYPETRVTVFPPREYCFLNRSGQRGSYV